MTTPRSRSVSAIASAWPAMLLAALVLLPFLNGSFTIDDPLYLREAEHALIDPLHPQDFNIVWLMDLDLHASRILPGGLVVPYLLIPTVLSANPEWVGHFTQLLLLLVTLYVTALTALRLGLDSLQARWVSLLTATCPAVLGMSATVMPDTGAMFFVALGMERVVAWREDRKWSQALLATCWLTLAALTRVHTIAILPAAFIFLLDGLTRDEIRASITGFPARFLPVLLTPLAFVVISKLAADPAVMGDTLIDWLMTFPGGRHVLAMNIYAFLAHLVLAVPFTIPWLILRFRKLPYMFVGVAVLVAGVLYWRAGWEGLYVASTLLVLMDILWDALQRRDRVQLALWLWLLVPLSLVVYIHLPPKYLLPSTPAAALLLVRLLPATRRKTGRILVSLVAAAGFLLGLAILLGSRDLADIQRRAVAELIVPHMKASERVWFSGHWGFHWYAEAAGARAATTQPPFPKAGDIIVISEIDIPLFPKNWYNRRILQRVSYPSSYGSVMNMDAGAGFFSNAYGYLPWSPSTQANNFEVWKVE